jgi:hypothetical protein
MTFLTNDRGDQKEGTQHFEVLKKVTVNPEFYIQHKYYLGIEVT